MRPSQMESADDDLFLYPLNCKTLFDRRSVRSVNESEWLTYPEEL